MSSRSIRGLALVASAAALVPLASFALLAALTTSACTGTYAPKEGAPPPRASDYARGPVPSASANDVAGANASASTPSASTATAITTATTTAITTSTSTATATTTSASRGKNDKPKTISARHILIQYMGAKRADSKIVRTREQARAVAEEVLQKLKGGASFARLVLDYSDEPNAGQRGGSLGRFKRGDMDKAFEEAAFALEPGQASGVVESSFGFHIIERLE